METKHTPGPWRIVDNESIKDSNNNLITVLICDLSFSPNTNMANIKLLAAAPELLRSCIHLLSELSVEADSEPEGYSRIVQDALRAIKKATE